MAHRAWNAEKRGTICLLTSVICPLVLGCGMRDAGCGLRDAGCGLRDEQTGIRRSVFGFGWRLRVARCELRVAGYALRDEQIGIRRTVFGCRSSEELIAESSKFKGYSRFKIGGAKRHHKIFNLQPSIFNFSWG